MVLSPRYIPPHLTLLTLHINVRLSIQIKYYLEGSGADRNAVRKLLDDVVLELKTEWMEASKNNLTEP